MPKKCTKTSCPNLATKKQAQKSAQKAVKKAGPKMCTKNPPKLFVKKAHKK